MPDANEEYLMRTSLYAAMAAVFLGSSLFIGGAQIANAGPATETSAVSRECSAKADEQKLAGKPRKSFRSKCMREAKKMNK